MCGRVGRPSFDDTGTVIIMTRKDTVHLYENLLAGCKTVESRTVKRWLMTSPSAPRTHWYQLRGVLSHPFYIMAGREISGPLCMVAHNARSYAMYLTMSAKIWGAERGGICLQANLMSYTATTILYMVPKISSHDNKLNDKS
ncbi:hypothetical protein MKW92_040946 [Papaver armeniacum]|nr:hypothetical protein MKW92_040946 [Papaver armeniacum]